MSRPERILVTGAAGFIGSTLVDRLLGEGRSVVGLDAFDPFYPEEQKRANLKGAFESQRFQLVEADIRDADALERIFSTEQIDAVVHLAALAGVRPSLEAPARYADVNVHGTAAVLEAAATHGQPRIVFASSAQLTIWVTESPSWRRWNRVSAIFFFASARMMKLFMNNRSIPERLKVLNA